MGLPLSEKVCLVTGGARRLGRAIALALAEAGADIAVHYNTSKTDAAETVRLIRGMSRRAEAFQADLLQDAAPADLVRRVVDRLGRIDVLVNNASLFVPGRLGELEAEQFRRMFQIHAIGPALLAQAAWEQFRRQGSAGRIVNISDVSADRPWSGYIPYCCSKAALVALTKSLAKAMGPHATVNAVAPGLAEWPAGFDEATRQVLIKKVPMGRPGSAADIAQVVRFLVEQGDYITGQVIPVDGGRSIA